MRRPARGKTRAKRRGHNRTPAPNREWLRVWEMAEEVGLSVSTLRRHAMDETCPATHSPHCKVVLFQRGPYIEWLTGVKQAAAGSSELNPGKDVVA